MLAVRDETSRWCYCLCACCAWRDVALVLLSVCFLSVARRLVGVVCVLAVRGETSRWLVLSVCLLCVARRLVGVICVLVVRGETSRWGYLCACVASFVTV